MESSETLEQLAYKLNALRQNPATRRRFPKEFWDSLSRLAETHSLSEICRSLHLNPAYVKDKITKNRETKLPDFCEVFAPFSGSVTIELSASGIQAKIQGPKECINYLIPLFRR